MCTLYTRVGAWVSPPEVENELLKCCLYTLQGGVEGGCPPPFPFPFPVQASTSPVLDLAWAGLAWPALEASRSLRLMSHQG